MTIPEAKRPLRAQLEELFNLCGGLSPIHEYLTTLDVELNSEDVDLNSFSSKLSKTDQFIRMFHNRNGYSHPDMNLVGHLVLYVVKFRNHLGFDESRSFYYVDSANRFIRKDIISKKLKYELFKTFNSYYLPINTPVFNFLEDL